MGKIEIGAYTFVDFLDPLWSPQVRGGATKDLNLDSLFRPAVPDRSTFVDEWSFGFAQP